MTLEEASKITTPEAGYSVYGNAYLAVQEKERLIETRANASIFEKTEAFGKTAAEPNMMVEWIKRATTADYEPDPEFIENNSDDRVQSIIEANQLHKESFLRLREAKSVWEEGEILQDLLDKRVSQEFVQDKLSEGWQTAASVTGSLVDIDTAIIGPLTGILGKGKKTADIAKTTFKIETTGVAVKASVEDDYHALKEGILDITVGTLADTTIAKYFSKETKGYADIAREQGILEKRGLDSFLKETTDHIQARALDEKIQASAQQRKANEQAARAKSDELLAAEKELAQAKKEAKELELTAQAQQRKAATKGQKVKSDELLVAEKGSAQAKDLELTTQAQKRKATAKLQRAKSDEIIGLELKQKRLKQEEADVRLRNREAERTAKVEDQMVRLDKKISDISKNLIPEVEKMKAQLRAISSEWDEATRSEALREMDDVVFALRAKFPEETEELLDLFKRVKATDVRVNPLKLAKTIKASKKLTGKQKAMFLGVATTGSAFAGEGDEEALPIMGIMAAAALAYAGGTQILQSVKNKDMQSIINQTIRKIKDTVDMAEYANSTSGSKTLTYINGLHQKFNNAFNSTYQEMMGYKDVRVKELADKLLLNPLDGSVVTADAEKMLMLRGEQATIDRYLKLGFQEYIDSKNISQWHPADLMEARAEFNKLVSSAMEGQEVVEAGVKETAAGISKTFKQALDYAKEVGVYGADQVTSTKDYLPRLWKFQALHEMIRGADEASLAAIRRQFVNMIKAPNAHETAEKLMDWFTDVKNFQGHQSDDILERLDEFLKGDYDKAAAKEALQTQSEKAGRLKARIEMDMTKFETVQVNINGVDMHIRLEDIVDRDIHDISDKYLNQMYGQIALAKRGYTSTKQLRDEINALGNMEAAASLHTVVDLVLGHPLKLNDAATHEWATTIKGLSFVALLPMVAFSMVPEALKAVSNAGLSMTLKNLPDLFKTMNKDSELFKTLTELTGLGTHSIRDRLDLKGIDNADIGEIGARSMHAQVSIRGQEALARMSGLVKFSDVFQRLTLLKSTTDFGNFIAGRQHGIPLSRLESYGITNDLKTMFIDDFKFADNGELLKINTDGWSYTKRTKFNDIMLRLNQEMTPEVVLGTIGKWTKVTDIGRMFSFLLSYPLNLYANQAIKDAKYMDFRAAQNTVMTFAGTYIGLAAKYELLGRDYEHEDLVKYSLLNLPSLSLLGAIRGLSDPATVSLMSRIKDDIDVIGNGTYEQMVHGE